MLTLMLPQKGLCLEVITAGKKAGTDYHNATKGKANHGQGQPFWHVWGCILKAVATCTEQSLQPAVKIVQDHLAILKAHTPQFCSRKIHQCRLKDADKDRSKSVHKEPITLLYLSCQGEAVPVMEALVSILTASGAILTDGPAPRGRNERILQEYLDKADGK